MDDEKSGNYLRLMIDRRHLRAYYARVPAWDAALAGNWFKCKNSVPLDPIGHPAINH
jgi:hypothetical protein